MFCSGIWSQIRYSMTLQFWEPPTFIYCKRLFFRYTQRGWPYDSVCKQCMFTPPSDNTEAAWVIPANNVTVLSSDDVLTPFSWWRHQMETFSALLAICAGNSPVPGELPAQRPVTRSFDVFFDLRLNKRLSKHWRCWWFQTLSCSLWRHCNAHRSSQSTGITVFCGEITGGRLHVQIDLICAIIDKVP